VIQEFLRTIPLFRELDDDELTQILMVGLVKRHPRGTSILEEGESGGRLYVITEGEVRISKVVPGVGEEALSILGPGEFFGEIQFFDGAPASAHVIAHSACEVFSLPHAEVEGLIRSRPGVAAKFIWAFGRTLAGRLRETNARLATLLALSIEPGSTAVRPSTPPRLSDVSPRPPGPPRVRTD
jgi:CRP/FNR family transcriptional regulator, cyclic AMP receptor protein